MPATLPKLTYEDYLSIPADGKRYELIDGELHVMGGPALSGAGDVRHQRVAGNLFVHLAELVRRNGSGEVFYAPLEVVLSNLDVVQPDLVFLARKHADRLRATHLAGPPDLAVEILSSRNRRYDEIVKRHLYDRAGVSEYWIVDPELEAVKVYRRGAAGGFERRAVELAAECGEVLETPLLPGLSLPVADLFSG